MIPALAFVPEDAVEEAFESITKLFNAVNIENVPDIFYTLLRTTETVMLWTTMYLYGIAYNVQT